MENRKLFDEMYNPDVLSCLANLSSDEVFTPPIVVNDMLDLLPKDIWKDKNIKFLDPVCKSGVFLREIAKRLIDGLEEEFPSLEERLDHIFKNQIYGIAITEITSLLSRRTVYCSKYPNSIFSIVNFDNINGNILYRNIDHSWKKDRCTYCGAPKIQYKRKDNLENYAYEFIHRQNLEEIFNMKFDVIVGNPPYHLTDSGAGSSAKPIYNLFVEQAIKLNPRYLTMIIPSRWMKGGKGLTSFRNNMINDTSIQTIYDFEDASNIFPGINLDGGVCYFLWDRNYNDKANYYYNSKDGIKNYSKRFMKVDFMDTVIRDYRQYSIIKKVLNTTEEVFSKIVSPRNPFGYNSDLFNSPERYENVKIYNENKRNTCKIYGVKGKKGGSKRIYKYISRNNIKKNQESIDKYKLFFSKAYMTTSTIPPKLILGYPETICTETFLKIGDFKNEIEMKNCLSYIKTKFFRALLFYNRHSLNISRDSFKLIPMQDFSKTWTDEELYKKYNLTLEEIDFIESLIKPME